METDKSLEQERRQDTTERLHRHPSLAVAPSTGFGPTSPIRGSWRYVVLRRCSTAARTQMILARLGLLRSAVPVVAVFRADVITLGSHAETLFHHIVRTEQM